MKNMRIFLTVLLTLLITIINAPTIANGCLEVERDALLTFRSGLNDPGNLMLSWHGPHCCNWSGITCDELTEHIVKLNLRNPFVQSFPPTQDWNSHAFTGELNPSLSSLQHLIHLDLSNHNFADLNVPEFISSFRNLVYLNLSMSSFRGAIPHEIGNLSRLQFLDLSGSQFTGLVPQQLGNLSDLRYLSLRESYPTPISASDCSWLRHLSNLRYLDMSEVNLDNGIDWLAINKMHLLKTVVLSGCQLSEIPTDLHTNLTSLTKLDLSSTLFHALLPNWLCNLTSLLYLDLSKSEFIGNFPQALTNLGLLKFLSLGGNNFEHVFLEPISKLHNLRGLDLSSMKLEGDIVDLIKRLSPVWYNLDFVNLSGNNLSGNISSRIVHMKNLSIINLGTNSLTGHLSSEIGTLTQLKELNLYSNSLSGIITEAHFKNLSNLELIDLSHNTLTIKMDEKWVPPFQLRFLLLGSCKVGPKFPSWLRKQTQLVMIELPNTSIVDVIPTWFWNMSLGYVDLSDNSIIGNLPASFQYSEITHLSLRSNNISGLIPRMWGIMEGLDLSRNLINGSVSYETCDMSDLTVLDLSNNAISGEIPICWMNATNLRYIDISNNQIIGELPISVGLLKNLEWLGLYNNKLSGEFPSILEQCKGLRFLSLGMNNFSGKIPPWIGKKLTHLVVLQLRSNQFSGLIPSELGDLSYLHILDLAHNSLVGPIPSSIGNLSRMKNASQCYTDVGDIAVYFTGETSYIYNNGQSVYSSIPLYCLINIDLSGNSITGLIPEEIWLLQAVNNLNLSKNFLIGEILETIDHMQSLESLDLSFNNLSGPIPSTLSSLSSIHHLNLSYNNFSGIIPVGRQLETISDPSIYAGNSYLCGSQIGKNCLENPSSGSINYDYDDNGMEMVYYSVALCVGFVLGFWFVWGVLIIQNAWKVTFFQMVDRFFDTIYVHSVAILCLQ